MFNKKGIDPGWIVSGIDEIREFYVQNSHNESELFIVEAPARLFDNPALFWSEYIARLVRQGLISRAYVNDYIEDGLYTPANHDEVKRIVGPFEGQLPAVIFQKLDGGFAEALKITDQWDERTIVVRTSDQLVAVYWSTSA